MIPEMIPDYTLCYIISGDQVLLGMKKRRFGEAKWNGFGGRVEKKDLSIEAGAVREVKEEVGLTVKEANLEKVGEILFVFTEKPELIRKVYIFLARDWQGDPLETEEMRPEWFAFDSVPYEIMWSADKSILPLLLAGKKIQGEVIYKNERDPDHTEKIRIV